MQAPLTEAAASQGPDSPGRQLPRVPGCQQQQKSLLHPCLALALLSHIAAAENLVLTNTFKITFYLLNSQDNTEATWAFIQRCTLTSKVVWSLISFRLNCVHQNNKQVDHHICFAPFVTRLPHIFLRSIRPNKEFAWKKRRVNHASSAQTCADNRSTYRKISSVFRVCYLLS